MCFPGRAQNEGICSRSTKTTRDPQVELGRLKPNVLPCSCFLTEHLPQAQPALHIASLNHFYNLGNFCLYFSLSQVLSLSLPFPSPHPLSSFQTPFFLWKVSSRMNSVFSDKASHKELTMHFNRNYLLWSISTLICYVAGFCGGGTKWHNTLQTKSLIKWHWENLASSSFYLPCNWKLN